MTLLAALAVGCADDSMPVVQMPEIDTSNPLLAEWDSQFLVETGTRLIDSHLAVISKEDFWAGKAAYTPITDAR